MNIFQKLNYSIFYFIVRFYFINNEIIFVYEHSRHGARGSINVNKGVFENNSFFDEYHSHWVGNGELTLKGKMQQYILGIRNRYKYPNLIDYNNYNPDELLIHVTNTSRSMESAFNQVLGMFKPSIDLLTNEKSIENISESDIYYYPPNINNWKIQKNKNIYRKIINEAELSIKLLKGKKKNLTSSFLTDGMFELKEKNKQFNMNIQYELFPDNRTFFLICNCSNYEKYIEINKNREFEKVIKENLENKYGKKLQSFFKYENKEFLYDYHNSIIIIDNFLANYFDNRDLKEFSLELGYYEKPDEISEEAPRLLEWIIPQVARREFPIRTLGKTENEFGTLAHAKTEYKAYTALENYSELDEDMARQIKELMDMRNKNSNNNNELDNKFDHNIKLLNKDDFNYEDDSSIKEEKEGKKKELNLNIDNAIEKDNFIGNDIPIKERNEDLNLNTFNGKGFNTAKNCIKFSNDLNFNENNINIKENNTNINNTNINININNNKINIGKQNNSKQIKKNTFRFKASDQPPQIKKGINNKVYNNQFDPSLPLTLLLSNISKGLFTPKACSQEKKGKEKSKNKIIKKNEKTNMNNIKPFLLKDIVSEKTATNKKIKYVNLLEKFKGSNKNINPLMKTANNGFNINKKIRGNYSMKNIINKPNNIRVSSSINSYQGYIPGNNLKTKEKIGTSYCKVTKSKSTENFFVYNTSKNYPKTPKEQYRQKFVKNNKKIFGFGDSFNTPKTSNINKNINYSKNSYGNIFKTKKNKLKKK